MVFEINYSVETVEVRTYYLEHFREVRKKFLFSLYLFRVDTGVSPEISGPDPVL